MILSRSKPLDHQPVTGTGAGLQIIVRIDTRALQKGFQQVFVFWSAWREVAAFYEV